VYEYIKGTLVDKDIQKAIVETGGIGYRLAIPLSTYTRLPALKTPIELFLSHIVREDTEPLYAFLTREERDLFELVITVSGIGPKTGLAIIGHVDIATFQRAIAGSDIRLLSKVPGIGKKTAERLIIEMRDKFKGKGKSALPSMPASFDGGVVSDAFSALVNLGYAPNEAQKAITSVMTGKKEDPDLGTLITAALREI
jgi:Holliday junction DNA helicase RuvA